MKHRYPVIAALLAACIAVLPAFAAAQDDDTYPTRKTLPDGVVLVVKLVSATEVKPTTGVVVAYGRVILPASFVADTLDGGPALAVMDGGGSIALNGRPATVREISQSGGLAILDVPGLMAPPVVLAQDPGEDGDELRFGGFPPAKQMAEGRGPMWLPARLSANVTAGVYGLQETPRLPNVTGLLFNRCDQWVGYSLAMGEPDLAAPLPPVVMFDPELGNVLARLGAPALSTAPCARPVVAEQAPEPANTSPEPEVPPQAEPGPAAVDADTAGDDTAAADTVDAATGSDDAPADAPAENAAHNEPLATNGVGESTPATGQADAPAPLPRWLPPAVGGALGMLLLVAVLLGWHRRGKAPVTDADTVELVAAPRQAAASQESPKTPTAERWPPGANAWLYAQATTPEGEALRTRCAVDADAFACVLGRADADLVLDNDSVSRVHLRLERRDGALMAGDLGSTNGTSIGAARCLSGEIVYLEPGETLQVGDLAVKFRLDDDEDSAP
ncbi:FHA domain-containing protein [Marinihelvus fidelis]|uniref:FHA domain-containing protein n=1 Tax=Marinihelvus fidelis TaxID=2613842 RepID=A0A5N0TC44_9GAMM|nr:FHA domain-containing protein [Marinihelvus fidelis]KAA9132592.1 FHA domain-containing protein [Marinihelvus fidelis]